MKKRRIKAGGAEKLPAGPIDKLCNFYKRIKTPQNLPALTLGQIRHFFEHHKDLEPGKWVKVEGWAGPDEACREILAGVERYKNAAKKPMF